MEVIGFVLNMFKMYQYWIWPSTKNQIDLFTTKNKLFFSVPIYLNEFTKGKNAAVGIGR